MLPNTIIFIFRALVLLDLGKVLLGALAFRIRSLSVGVVFVPFQGSRIALEFATVLALKLELVGAHTFVYCETVLTVFC